MKVRLLWKDPRTWAEGQDILPAGSCTGPKWATSGGARPPLKGPRVPIHSSLCGRELLLGALNPSPVKWE